MDAVIPAAGRGNGLGELTDDRPRGLVDVAVRPLLAYTFKTEVEAGADELVVIGGTRWRRSSTGSATLRGDFYYVRPPARAAGARACGVTGGAARRRDVPAHERRQRFCGKRWVRNWGCRGGGHRARGQGSVARGRDNDRRDRDWRGGASDGNRREPANPSSTVVTTGCYVLQRIFSYLWAATAVARGRVPVERGRGVVSACGVRDRNRAVRRAREREMPDVMERAAGLVW